MIRKIKELFGKKSKKNFDTVKWIEEKYPIGSWYKSGDGIIRVSNIYTRSKKTLITVEKPVKTNNHAEPYFSIEKEDDLNPSFLNGWNRVEDKENKKLEKSYWKTIEKELEARTVKTKKFYDDFIRVGGK